MVEMSKRRKVSGLSLQCSSKLIISYHCNILAVGIKVITIELCRRRVGFRTS